MKSINVNAIIFLGGIVVISLGYQLYTTRNNEAFTLTAEQAAADAAANNENIRKGVLAFAHIPIDDKKAILLGLQSGLLLGIDMSNK
jgi:hypothetical protein